MVSATDAVAERSGQPRPGLFVSWAPHCSRSDSIAWHLGSSSHMVYAPFWGSHHATVLVKYFVQAVRTLRLLMAKRPAFVFVMTPPVVACLPVWLYCAVARVPYVIDAHTGALLDSRWQRLAFLHRFFSRRARATLVTNRHLHDLVTSWGAPCVIVPDVPVRFAPAEPVALDGGCHMTVASSFTPDEPIEVLLDAARRVPEVTFHVTGDPATLPARLLAGRPRNVRFTGFLPATEYAGLLMASDAVIALTRREHTMQRAAYEAVYLGKPVVVSNTALLRAAFNTGAVHVENTAEDIARGVRQMAGALPRYRDQAARLRETKLNIWQATRTRLQALLNGR